MKHGGLFITDFLSQLSLVTSERSCLLLVNSDLLEMTFSRDAEHQTPQKPGSLEVKNLSALPKAFLGSLHHACQRAMCTILLLHLVLSACFLQPRAVFHLTPRIQVRWGKNRCLILSRNAWQSTAEYAMCFNRRCQNPGV